jgi:hypothetical protein
MFTDRRSYIKWFCCVSTSEVRTTGMLVLLKTGDEKDEDEVAWWQNITTSSHKNQSLYDHNTLTRSVDRVAKKELVPCNGHQDLCCHG